MGRLLCGFGLLFWSPLIGFINAPPKRDRRAAARYDQKLLFFSSESPWMCCRGHLFCPDLGNEASPRVVPLSSRAFFAGEGLSFRAHSAGNR